MDTIRRGKPWGGKPDAALREREALVTKHYARHWSQKATRRKPSRSAANLTAVCIAGSMRTFLQAEVQHSFVRHVHYAGRYALRLCDSVGVEHSPHCVRSAAGYEYFVSTDKAQPPKGELLLAPLRAWIRGPPYGTDFLDQESSIPRCPPNMCNPHRFLQPSFLRLADCYYAMQASRPSLSHRRDRFHGGRDRWRRQE